MTTTEPLVPPPEGVRYVRFSGLTTKPRNLHQTEKERTPMTTPTNPTQPNVTIKVFRLPEGQWTGNEPPDARHPELVKEITLPTLDHPPDGTSQPAAGVKLERGSLEATHTNKKEAIGD